MIGCCEHITVNKGAERYDPTRTITLRRAFVRDMKRRFVNLARLIRQVIVDEDGFGISVNQSFGFETTAQKTEAFMAWLNEQIGFGLLETKMMTRVGGGFGMEPWTSIYIQRAYEVGVNRATREMKNAGIYADATGTATITAPYHAERLALLYTRTYSELKGITAAMEQQISRVLSEGMARGDSPRLIADRLVATMRGGGADLGITDTLGRYIPAERRAAIMARTEVIRAHHQATINEYRAFGVAGVKIKAEWSTAGDDRVCEQCSSMEGNIYTLDEIESMIPVHPQCRCLALPVME